MQGLSKYHMTTTDLALESDEVKAAQTDPAQFEPLYRRYHHPVFMFVLKRVESEETAEDVTSQVFLKALANIRSYREMGVPFSAWLFRIARNTLYDLYTSKKLQLVLSIDRENVLELVAEMRSDRREDYEPLYLALSRLDESEVELIELRFFEGRPFKEVGDILGITENNAKVRTYRVLDKLKALLK